MRHIGLLGVVLHCRKACDFIIVFVLYVVQRGLEPLDLLLVRKVRFLACEVFRHFLEITFLRALFEIEIHEFFLLFHPLLELFFHLGQLLIDDRTTARPYFRQRGIGRGRLHPIGLRNWHTRQRGDDIACLTTANCCLKLVFSVLGRLYEPVIGRGTLSFPPVHNGRTRNVFKHDSIIKTYVLALLVLTGVVENCVDVVASDRFVAGAESAGDDSAAGDDSVPVFVGLRDAGDRITL